MKKIYTKIRLSRLLELQNKIATIDAIAKYNAELYTNAMKQVATKNNQIVALQARIARLEGKETCLVCGTEMKFSIVNVLERVCRCQNA